MSEHNLRAVGNADAIAAAGEGWPSRIRRRINSHETFVHDSIDGLGYDWARIADPHITPKFPLKVYLPHTTDDVLAAHGLRLPVIGDHADLTMGGFSAVDGISASSFRFGLFADTVQRLEYVTWGGELISCSRSERPDHFYNVLLG